MNLYNKPDKPEIKLTEKEYIIIQDIITAASSLDAKYSIDLPKKRTIGEIEVKSAKQAFDLFQLIDSGNIAAVSKVTSKDGAEVISVYKLQRINTDYNPDDIYILKTRLKAFLKEIASKNVKPRTLYIADCHFYHNNICHEMDMRGFSDFEEMNEYMIKQWNDKVTSKDNVYILGDLSVAKSEATVKILERLNGKLHLIIGNHDRFIEDKSYSWGNWFKSIEYYQEIRDNGRNVILSHYPVFCYKGQYRRDKNGIPRVYMLYGHVHNTHDEILVNQFIRETRNTRVMSRHSTEPEHIPCNMINCFCMFSDYRPMTLDEWISIDEKRRNKM